MIRRKFGFDWGQTLEVNEFLRQIARDLYVVGHEIHIITACGESFPPDSVYTYWLKGVNVPFTKIHRIIVNDLMLPGEKEALKVDKMKEIGCHILYDDSLEICQAVINAGMEAVWIRGNHTVPIPQELHYLFV